ncbi:ypt2 [Symbiodinium sp. CCMP2592]|nr:ypt2 [Symbiodinium sp. CCMP2592]
MAPAVPLDFTFADPEDAMGDWEQVDPPEVSTPEHWSDVGLLSARTGLLEQQLQATQAQLSQMAGQLATVAQLSHNLQHLEMQLVLQRQQHQEDMVKMMAAQAVSLSNLTPSTRTKARPGPRERQKLREERRAQEPAAECQLQVASSSASTLEPDLSTLEVSEPPLAAAESEAPSQPGSAAEAQEQEPPEVASQPAAAAPQASELAEAKVTKTFPARSSQRWSGVSWCAVILAWSLYLAGDMWSPFTWGMIDDGQVADTTADEDLAGSRNLAQNAASRLRELGHLQLSVSDCHGAAKLFARAEVLLGNNSAPAAQLVELRRERGFALVCAQHFSEGAALLREALLESMQTSSPIHLPMLAEDQLDEPVDGPVHLMNALSFAYFYLGEFSRAKGVLERAVTLYPENPLVWNNLGAVHLALGDTSRADKTLHAALARARKLTGDHTSYYQQLVSNNIHTQRVGKTALVVKFVDDGFKNDNKPTFGIDFKNKMLWMGGKRVKIQIWDTAGQERHHTITKQYYRSAMGILLCYDVTREDSFQNIKRWNEQIELHGAKDVQRILVGNKVDAEDIAVSPERGRALAEQYGMPFFEASAWFGDNVNEAFLRLTEMVIRQRRREDEPFVPNSLRLHNDESASKGRPCCIRE